MRFWTPGEVRLMFQAVAQAPSVHNIQPWVLELHERNLLLFERWEHPIPQHDPKGRDRLMSCGAALTNLELSMRHLGWETLTTYFPDRAQPDLVATVTAVRPQAVTESDRALYQAIPRRRSQRFAFDGEPLTDEEIREIRHALIGERVGCRRVTGRQEAEMVAAVSEHAADVLRHDHRYQRELRALTFDRGKTRLGLPASRIEHGLFGGLVHSGDSVPDHEALTSLIARECVFVIETLDDTRRDHVLAGQVTQRAWLTATRLGIAASVITQSLQVPEVRAGLSEKLGLAGFPHALMRFGRAARVPQASPRRTFSDVVRGQ